MKYGHLGNTHSPCKDCDKRHRACWDTCEAYKKFVEHIRQDKKARKKYLSDYYDATRKR